MYFMYWEIVSYYNQTLQIFKKTYYWWYVKQHLGNNGTKLLGKNENQNTFNELFEINI